MWRKILTTIGIIELLWPKSLITAAEWLALEKPDECELRSWAVSGVRVEGLVFIRLMRRREASYSTVKKFLGIIGVFSLIYPRRYIDSATTLAYTDATNCNWKPWVYHATRLVGLLYVIIAINELRKG